MKPKVIWLEYVALLTMEEYTPARASLYPASEENSSVSSTCECGCTSSQSLHPVQRMAGRAVNMIVYSGMCFILIESVLRCVMVKPKCQNVAVRLKEKVRA